MFQASQGRKKSQTIKTVFIIRSHHILLTSWTPHSKHLFSSTGSGVWQYRQTGHLSKTPKDNDRLNRKQLLYHPTVKNLILNTPSLISFIITKNSTQNILLSYLQTKWKKKPKILIKQRKGRNLHLPHTFPHSPV